jgi:hypothetical protein
MAEQLNRMMSMFGGGGAPGGGAGGEGGMPDMSQLLAQMMGGGPGDAPMPADRLLGDMDDPAGFNPPPGFPDMSSMGMGMGGMGGGFPGMGGMGMGGAGHAKKSWIVKLFPLIHALAMVLLVGFTIIWWEPRVSSMRTGVMDRSWADRFGDLRGVKRFGDDFRITALTRGVGVVVSASPFHFGHAADLKPFFWAFTTLELIIQTTRFFLLKVRRSTFRAISCQYTDFQSPPPPHSLLQTFLPIIPPNLARPLVTASRYFSLLSQMLKDGFLLVFLLGLVVILANHLS